MLLTMLSVLLVAMVGCPQADTPESDIAIIQDQDSNATLKEDSSALNTTVHLDSMQQSNEVTEEIDPITESKTNKQDDGIGVKKQQQDASGTQVQTDESEMSEDTVDRQEQFHSKKDRDRFMLDETVEVDSSNLEIATAGADHSPWNALLDQYVAADGRVNYSAWQAAQSGLTEYLQLLAQDAPDQGWSRSEAMAYWINAYNAFTVKLILDNYPLKSIMDLHHGKPWDVPWIVLEDQKYSLNQIENEILRPQFKDARIHFAVNCAARSCPPLTNQAFTAENLDGLLERRTRDFINATQYNTIASDNVQISKIFEWYAVDFGDLLAYLNKYARVKIDAGASITYQDYDWSLNE